MGPVIGICMQYGESEATFGIDRRYVGWLAGVGAVPLLIPPLGDRVALDRALGLVQGLVIPGGNDIDPARYGAEPSPNNDSPVPLRDEAETYLLAEAFRRDLPYLGVCRGLQVMNVALGGTLIQQLNPDASPVRHSNREPVSRPHHDVRPVSGGLLDRIVGTSPLAVASLHHQAVDRVADPLVVEATAADGVIEALSAPARRFFLGVQWHPEMFAQTPGSRALAEALAQAASDPTYRPLDSR